MPIDFRRVRINFDPTTGREQHETGAVVFPSAVRRAEVAINGYSISYNNGDHHILTQKIDTNVSRIDGGTVFVDVGFLLRDSSGNIDDPFSGFVEVMVIADRA
jgi:hypothetical protein